MIKIKENLQQNFILFFDNYQIKNKNEINFFKKIQNILIKSEIFHNLIRSVLTGLKEANNDHGDILVFGNDQAANDPNLLRTLAST